MRVSLPEPALRASLGAWPGVELIDWPMEGPAPVPDIDLVVTPHAKGRAPLQWLATVRTRAVQLLSLGYDGIEDVVPPGHLVSNGVGLHEASTAELALALTLASLRDIPRFVRQAQDGRWSRERRPSLADRHVLLIGQGGVGRAIDARLAPFEVTITRVASRSREGVHGIDAVHALLPNADVVMLAVPLTAKTRGLVDTAFLGAMKDGALVVNVARGAVIDGTALRTEALRGRLHFALDTVDPEPLPADDVLWRLPNVVISPHAGGMSTALFTRAARLIRQQVERIERGLAPLHVVLDRRVDASSAL